MKMTIECEGMRMLYDSCQRCETQAYRLFCALQTMGMKPVAFCVYADGKMSQVWSEAHVLNENDELSASCRKLFGTPRVEHCT